MAENSGIPEKALEIGKKVVPGPGRILVWPCEVEFTDVERRIITPDTAQDQPDSGVICSVGADVRDYVAGDVIVFGRHSGYGISDDLFQIIRDQDVMAELHGVSVKARGGETSNLLHS